MIGLDPDHAMNSFNPLLMLWIAVARQSVTGQVYGPDQKLSRIDALRCITQWAAHLSFDEQKVGSLVPDTFADFVVLDRDYLACPEDEIREIRVLRTVVGGATVYQRPQE
jgi:predicted amidohydrolase YtcJ